MDYYCYYCIYYYYCIYFAVLILFCSSQLYLMRILWIRPKNLSKNLPALTCTPKTPPVGSSTSQSLKRAMAQLRHVSMADTLKIMAGKDLVKALQNFDRHYMPDCQPDADDSERGNDCTHRSDLKRKQRVLPEVLARYLRSWRMELLHWRKPNDCRL